MKICALYKAVVNEQLCVTYDIQNIIQTSLWYKLFIIKKLLRIVTTRKLATLSFFKATIDDSTDELRPKLSERTA